MVDEGRNCQWVGGGLMKIGYFHSLMVFFHKILTNYQEGNGDLMVKISCYNFVQVIEVYT